MRGIFHNFYQSEIQRRLDEFKAENERRQKEEQNKQYNYGWQDISDAFTYASPQWEIVKPKKKKETRILTEDEYTIE